MVMDSLCSLLFAGWLSQIPLELITKFPSRADTSLYSTHVSIRNRLPSSIRFNSIIQKIVIIYWFWGNKTPYHWKKISNEHTEFFFLAAPAAYRSSLVRDWTSTSAKTSQIINPPHHSKNPNIRNSNNSNVNGALIRCNAQLEGTTSSTMQCLRWVYTFSNQTCGSKGMLTRREHVTDSDYTPVCALEKGVLSSTTWLPGVGTSHCSLPGTEGFSGQG